ncbi:hypothetical protein ACVWYG_000912 [Pedobacter sp. UYEF25]
MALISDQIDVDGFGTFGGMERCARCVAEVLDLQSQFPKSDKNEYLITLKVIVRIQHKVELRTECRH